MLTEMQFRALLREKLAAAGYTVIRETTPLHRDVLEVKVQHRSGAEATMAFTMKDRREAKDESRLIDMLLKVLDTAIARQLGEVA